MMHIIWLYIALEIFALIYSPLVKIFTLWMLVLEKQLCKETSCCVCSVMSLKGITSIVIYLVQLTKLLIPEWLAHSVCKICFDIKEALLNLPQQSASNHSVLRLMSFVFIDGLLPVCLTTINFYSKMSSIQHKEAVNS